MAPQTGFQAFPHGEDQFCCADTKSYTEARALKYHPTHFMILVIHAIQRTIYEIRSILTLNSFQRTQE